jgi:hypothetical protein
MKNPFNSRVATLSGPARDYYPVSPDDVLSLPQVAVALYAETGGRVVFVAENGQTRDVGVGDYGWILCGITQVRATGTTASGLHAMMLS